MRCQKVLHLVSSAGLYGAETVILNLSKELNRSQFIPVVGMITERGKPMPDIGHAANSLEIETALFPLRFRFDPAGLFGIKNYLINNNINVVHSHGYKATVLGFLPSLFLRIPLVATCHLWANEADPKLKLYHEIEAWIMKCLPAVVGVSQPICRELVRKGIKHNRVKLIHNGISLSNYGQCSEQKTLSLMNELDISENDFIVGTAGRLNWQKAHHYLLDAIKILKDKNLEAKYLIVGDGPLRKSLEAQCHSLGLQDRVCFTGFRHDIINILDLIDIFVLTSVDEGLPMVLLEAMAMKKAIVSTPVGEIGSIIHHGVNGYIYPVGDVESLARHIISLINDNDMRQNLGNEAHKTFEKHYTSEIMARKYMNLYKMLLSN